MFHRPRTLVQLIELSSDHRKIVLYANPGREAFYEKLGSLAMQTTMAIFRDRQGAIASGILAPHR